MKLTALTVLVASVLAAQESPIVNAAKSGRRPAIQPSFNAALPLNPVQWYNGAPFAIEKARGRVLLLDFWATWCGPCVREQPRVAELVKKLANPNFSVLLVHARNTRQWKVLPGQSIKLDEVPAEKVLPAFIKEHHIELPVVVAGDRDFHNYDVNGIPHYVLIDKKGLVRYESDGTIPTETEVRKLLNE